MLQTIEQITQDLAVADNIADTTRYDRHFIANQVGEARYLRDVGHTRAEAKLAMSWGQGGLWAHNTDPMQALGLEMILDEVYS